MTTRQRTAATIASAVAFFLIAALLLTAWVLLLKSNQHAEPQPTVTGTTPAVTPDPEPAACAAAAQVYYEHFVALVAESRALAQDGQPLTEQWQAERLEPLVASTEGAWADLLECREGATR